jgi:hypothetical protein
MCFEKSSFNVLEDDHGEEGEESDEGKEKSRCSKKDDEEIHREEVGQEDYGKARRKDACPGRQSRQIFGTQTWQEGDRQGGRKEGQARQLPGTQANKGRSPRRQPERPRSPNLRHANQLPRG